MRERGVTIFPIYARVLLANAGSGIRKNKKTNATQNPTRGAGNKFFQLNLAALEEVPDLLSLVIR